MLIWMRKIWMRKIWMRKRLCKQACNTLSHSNQRMAELNFYIEKNRY